MRRGVNGADAFETINAAATAIASVENRGPRASAQKKRWGSRWSLYWCFGFSKNKRIGHADLVPETDAAEADTAGAEHPSQPPSTVLPFIAPPSSPASFLPSDPPSATQSPIGVLSLSSVPANMHSPGGPASIFAIGPYAHETQLVSPPVFSTFTTEPSTAPFTPPPESVHLTTPYSPEVPFARLLEPNLQNGEVSQRLPFSQYEFQSYQLQPGSPVSHLISPSSGISGSGTSSPFPDRELAAGHPFLLELRTGTPPTVLDLDKIGLCEWELCQGSAAVTPDTTGPRSCGACLFNRQCSDVASLPDKVNTCQNDEPVNDHRVSFVMEKKPTALLKSSLRLVENVGHREEEKLIKMANGCESPAGETSSNISRMDHVDNENKAQHQKNRTITLGSAKEFNFDNVDGGNPSELSIGSSEWWVNERIMQRMGVHVRIGPSSQ